MLGRIVNEIEETVIALLLAGMTITTFVQVVLRYVFNTGFVWALELTITLFAWLVLFGISYGVKIGTHLGVDAFIRLFPRPIFRGLAVFGALAGVLYAAILLDAAWLGIFGIEKKGGAIQYVELMHRIGITTEDLRWPRWLVYMILPVGLALFALRCLQAAWQIVKGERELISASHEAEELVREHQGAVKD